MTIEKVIKDRKVAVLYSPGFGAGWYSWNKEHKEMLFDPNIVHWVLADKKENISAYAILKYPDTYLGGLEDLTVIWIPEGTAFRVDEYDGSESVEVKEDMDWMIA